MYVLEKNNSFNLDGVFIEANISILWLNKIRIQLHSNIIIQVTF